MALNQKQLRDLRFDTLDQIQASNASGGVENTIAICIETDTMYSFKNTFPEPPNGTSILPTGLGGDTRWVGIAGQYMYYVGEAADGEALILTNQDVHESVVSGQGVTFSISLNQWVRPAHPCQICGLYIGEYKGQPSCVVLVGFIEGSELPVGRYFFDEDSMLSIDPTNNVFAGYATSEGFLFNHRVEIGRQGPLHLEEIEASQVGWQSIIPSLSADNPAHMRPGLGDFVFDHSFERPLNLALGFHSRNDNLRSFAVLNHNIPSVTDTPYPEPQRIDNGMISIRGPEDIASGEGVAKGDYFLKNTIYSSSRVGTQQGFELLLGARNIGDEDPLAYALMPDNQVDFYRPKCIAHNGTVETPATEIYVGGDFDEYSRRRIWFFSPATPDGEPTGGWVLFDLALVDGTTFTDIGGDGVTDWNADTGISATDMENALNAAVGIPGAFTVTPLGPNWTDGFEFHTEVLYVGELQANTRFLQPGEPQVQPFHQNRRGAFLAKIIHNFDDPDPSFSIDEFNVYTFEAINPKLVIEEEEIQFNIRGFSSLGYIEKEGTKRVLASTVLNMQNRPMIFVINGDTLDYVNDTYLDPTDVSTSDICFLDVANFGAVGDNMPPHILVATLNRVGGQDVPSIDWFTFNFGTDDNLFHYSSMRNPLLLNKIPMGIDIDNTDFSMMEGEPDRRFSAMFRDGVDMHVVSNALAFFEAVEPRPNREYRAYGEGQTFRAIKNLGFGMNGNILLHGCGRTVYNTASATRIDSTEVPVHAFDTNPNQVPLLPSYGNSINVAPPSSLGDWENYTPSTIGINLFTSVPGHTVLSKLGGPFNFNHVPLTDNIVFPPDRVWEPDQIHLLAEAEYFRANDPIQRYFEMSPGITYVTGHTEPTWNETIGGFTTQQPGEYEVWDLDSTPYTLNSIVIHEDNYYYANVDSTAEEPGTGTDWIQAEPARWRTFDIINPTDLNTYDHWAGIAYSTPIGHPAVQTPPFDGGTYWVSNTAPTINNDEEDSADLGFLFRAGYLWVNQTENRAWICTNSTPGNAQWVEITPAGPLCRRFVIEEGSTDVPDTLDTITGIFEGSEIEAELDSVLNNHIEITSEYFLTETRIKVFVDGVMLEKGIHVECPLSNTLTFNVPITEGSIITIFG